MFSLLGVNNDTAIVNLDTEEIKLEAIFNKVCPDIDFCEYLLPILKAPLINQNDILYRQDLLKDFLTYPELLPNLCKAFDEYKRIVIEDKRSKKEFYNSVANSYHTDISRVKSALQLNANLLKKVLVFLKKSYDLLMTYNTKSSAIKMFKDRLSLILSTAEKNNIYLICNEIEHFSLQNPFSVSIQLNEDGRCDFYTVNLSNKKKQLSLNEKSKFKYSFLVNNINSFDIKKITFDQFPSIVIEAFEMLSYEISKITNSLLIEFSNVSNELIFYKAVIRLCSHLSLAGLVFNFPEFNNYGHIHIKSLYDLYLLTEKKNITEVVPNDFILTNKQGGLIMGENSTGKTVFARSFAIMQLFAQVGLPVVASSINTIIFDNISIVFSTVDNEISIIDAKGRFELEVEKMSMIIETIGAQSLVILNEPFQSTSYSEAADALIPILDYMSQKNVRWLIVTHITALEQHCRNWENIVLYKTTLSHKILSS